jgi:hypothetical protein
MLIDEIEPCDGLISLASSRSCHRFGREAFSQLKFRDSLVITYRE